MRSRKVFLFAMETIADTLSAMVFVQFYFLMIALLKGRIASFEDIVKEMPEVIVITTLIAISMSTRVVTQIPVTAWHRFRQAKNDGYAISDVMRIVIVAYFVGYAIVVPTSFVLGPVLFFGETLDFEKLGRSGPMLLFLFFPMPPLLVAATLAPYITYRLFGGVFEAPHLAQSGKTA